jgi:hypothetical protein
MRLRVFGVSRLLLFIYGLFPLLVWSGFHFSSLVYRREDAAWAIALGILLCAAFVFFFRRGGFWIRYVWAGVTLLELLWGIVPAVIERDFASIGGILGVLVSGVVMVIWLERKVDSASLNPRALWFEGELKCIPRMQARVRSGDGWTQARVRRIDDRGLFLLQETMAGVRAGQSVEFELEHEGQKVGGTGRVVAFFMDHLPGLGLLFLPKDLYHFQQYTALVRRLRGEGL